MRMTIKTEAAIRLGSLFGQFHFPANDEHYPEAVEDMRADFRQLGMDPALLEPSPEGFRRQEAGLLAKVLVELQHERSQLGGDVYAYTLFTIFHVTFWIVANAALDLEFAGELDHLALALSDLQIDEADVRSFLDEEARRLAERAGTEDRTVPRNEVLRAYGRIISRVGELWDAGERRRIESLPPLVFGRIPGDRG